MGPRVKKAVSAIAFIAVLAMVFNFITQLYRPSEGFDRAHIIAFDEQENLDVVYIGASTCLVYWQPLNAWKDYGITSYDYSTNGLEAVDIEYMVRNSERTNDPDLYVIGVRPFQLWTPEGNTARLRYVTDSWSLLYPDRYRLINSFFDKHIIEGKADYPSYWFDVAYYHDNADVLRTPENWQYGDQKERVTNYGWEWIDLYQYLKTPLEADWRTNERAPLEAGAERTLRSLCEYCTSEDLNVLFVVCPYYIAESDERVYNTIGDIVSEYGFDYLNANEYYDEMDIDFASDFYNTRHVNCFGAEKYTAFLGKYITEKYDLKDHRGESGYELWDADYARFASEETQYKESILRQKEDAMSGYELADQLRNYDNISDWYMATYGSRYTIIVYNNGLEIGQNEEIDRICEKWDISTDQKNCNIIIDGEIKESVPVDAEMLMEGVAGQDSPNYGLSYSIRKDHIVIDGIDYYDNDAGLIIIAVDNPLSMQADSIAVKQSQDTYSIFRDYGVMY